MATQASRVETALDALGKAGLRRTPQRVAVVRAFVDDHSHPTAQLIFDRLRRSMPTMSFATVYNTLDALERAGACRALRLPGTAGDAGGRYDPNVAPHDHAICDRCGAVVDVPPARGTTAEIEGFRVRSVERVFRGACAACIQSPPNEE